MFKINLFPPPADFQNIRRKKKHGKQIPLKNKVILFIVKRTKSVVDEKQMRQEMEM